MRRWKQDHNRDGGLRASRKRQEGEPTEPAHLRHSGWAGCGNGKLPVFDPWRLTARTKKAVETPGLCAQPGMAHGPGERQAPWRRAAPAHVRTRDTKTRLDLALANQAFPAAVSDFEVQRNLPPSRPGGRKRAKDVDEPSLKREAADRWRVITDTFVDSMLTQTTMKPRCMQHNGTAPKFFQSGKERRGCIPFETTPELREQDCWIQIRDEWWEEERLNHQTGRIAMRSRRCDRVEQPDEERTTLDDRPNE